MKTAKEMQNYITGLARQYGVDLSVPGAKLCLEQGPYVLLTVERIGLNQIVVRHPFTVSEARYLDSDVIFFTGYDTWVPAQLGSHITGFISYAILSDDSQRIEYLIGKPQANLARRCRKLARQLKAQGWHKYSRLRQR